MRLDHCQENAWFDQPVMMVLAGAAFSMLGPLDGKGWKHIGVACTWNRSPDAGNFELPFVGDLKIC